MPAPRRNLEIKARCADLAAARVIVVGLCGETGVVERQRDTYFPVPSGRLKLREIDGESAVLIAYTRPDKVGSRLSQYHLVPVPDPAALKAALSGCLGFRGSVRKCREIFLWKNVRIHLDQVDGLGDFIEFEAVLGECEDESAARPLLADLCTRLGLADFLAASYSDLLGL